MGAHLRSRRLLELDLREALPNRQLELVYQPLFNLELRRDYRIRGAPAMASPVARNSSHRSTSYRSWSEWA